MPLLPACTKLVKAIETSRQPHGKPVALLAHIISHRHNWLNHRQTVVPAHLSSVWKHGVFACNWQATSRTVVSNAVNRTSHTRCAASSEPQATTANTNSAHDAVVQGSSRLQLPLAPDLQGAVPQGRWNAVSLAYLGDGVWEALLRSRFYDPSNSWQYGNKVAAMGTTQAQAACYQLLLDEGWVTPAEAALMRWATNNTSVAPPAHATRQQYKQATAMEALVAHLYLTDAARLQQLTDWLFQPEKVQTWHQPIALPPQAQRTSYAIGKDTSSTNSSILATRSCGGATAEQGRPSMDHGFRRARSKRGK